MFKKCKVVMLPTNEKASIKLGQNGLLVNNTFSYDSHFTNQHLYILSDEEIEGGDWVICSDFESSYQTIGKVSHIGGPINFKNTIQINGNPDLSVDRHVLDYTKKIIATTDKSLKIADFNFFPEPPNTAYRSLPQPSQSFIEKYVEEYNKGNLITEVLVEYEAKMLYDTPDLSKIHNKGTSFLLNKETESITHEIILKINPKDNTITIRKMKDSWNREEVIKLINTACEDCCFNPNLLDIWIEKNLY